MSKRGGIQLLKREEVVFVLVDVQGKLAHTVYNHEVMLQRLTQLIQGLKVLDIPMLWLEQYPEGLGPTTEEIAKLMPKEVKPISKITFNACLNDEFMEAVEAIERKQVLLAGIEAHICLYQTAMGLNERGYDVQVVADAVSSRTKQNKRIGLGKMKAHGIPGTSVEMLLYELMEAADIPEFKEVLEIVK